MRKRMAVLEIGEQKLMPHLGRHLGRQLTRPYTPRNHELM